MKTGPNEEKQQKPVKWGEPGVEPPCQRNGTAVPPWHGRVPGACHPVSRFSI